MKTPNSSKVAAGEKRGPSEAVTPKLDSLCNDAGVSGIMTRSRLKQLRDSTGKVYGTSVSSVNMRRALLRCFEDLPGTASQESTCPSNKKSQKNTLLEAGSVTPSDNNSVISKSQSIRLDRSLKSDNDDEQDRTNAHKSVSVALYNASETESPFVTVTVSGLCNNIKAAIMIHDVKKGSKEVCETDFKVNSSLQATNDDEQSLKPSKKERKTIKSRKKSWSSLNENEWTVTAVSEHITECVIQSDVVKFPQESDEVPLRNTELINGPSVSSTNDELSPNNLQKESQIKNSRKSKSPPPNKNGSAVPTAQEHITELENEMCKIKSPQKFNRRKNMLNPTVSISPLAAEFERLKSGSIRYGETPVKNSTNLESGTKSEVNTPLSGVEPLDRPLIPSNKGEPSPDYLTTERKAQKSRKGNSSLLKGNEGTVTAVSEHITAFEDEIGMVEPYRGSGKCSLKSTEPQDGPSLTSNGDTLSPSNSHKESKLKNSRKSKSSPPDKNEWKNISTVPEGTTELGNEMSEVKTPQKFDKCKNGGNPFMTVSQLPAEIEECPESVVIGERETQMKNLSDTESALADKACGVNHTSDGDFETNQLESNHNAKSSPLLKSKKPKEVRSESSESDSDAESRKAIMESAQRRIIQNISTSESESKKYVQPRTVSTGSDTSDSVPEAMSFSAGRQLVMESRKNAADSIQREKQRRKEKRKERLEKYKQQKEEKLIRLKEKRASQEDASCSSSEESGYEEVDVLSVLENSNRKAGPKWKKENLDDSSRSKGKQFHSDDEREPKGMKAKKRKNEQKDPSQHCGNLRKLPDDVLKNLPDQVPMKLQKTDSAATSEGKRSLEKHAEGTRQEYKKQRDIDYIPLSTCGATEFGVVPLDKFMRTPKSMAERAAEFKQNMLFGTRIKRGPANAQAIYQHKLKASGKDRFFKTKACPVAAKKW